MVLVDTQIIDYVKKVKMIEPFDEKRLQSESYDVTVGSNVTLLKRCYGIIDMTDDKDLKNQFETIQIDKQGYVLEPLSYVLVSLAETFNIPERITAHIRPKTSFNRMGLLITAQHFNSTYSGNLKLGLFNATNNAIRIRQGCPLAQVVFEELTKDPDPNRLYKNKCNAHYQKEDSHFKGPSFDDDYLSTILRSPLEK